MKEIGVVDEWSMGWVHAKGDASAGQLVSSSLPDVERATVAGPPCRPGAFMVSTYLHRCRCHRRRHFHGKQAGVDTCFSSLLQL